MDTLIIGPQTDLDSPVVQKQLGLLYERRQRPRCGCCAGTPELYIARIEGHFIVKRMPNTGVDHAWHCDSYEPPQDLSGVGSVAGTAIREDTDSGTVALRLGFSLSKATRQMQPSRSGTHQVSAKSEAPRLSLRAFLHYLWDEARLTRWYPAMRGKRHWYLVRRLLLRATRHVTVRNSPLSERFIVPKYFTTAAAAKLSQERAAFLGAAPGKGTGNAMHVFVGEVNRMESARFGFQLKLKDWPDFPLRYDDAVERALNRTFGTELDLWDSTNHLVAAGTLWVSESGIAHVNEVTLMLVNQHWLPIESKQEQLLLDDLVRHEYVFKKSLRYDLANTQPMPSVIVTGPVPLEPHAMYLLPAQRSASYGAIFDELRRGTDVKAWMWDLEQSERPALPEVASRAGNAP